jgi:RES domain-containing protein
MFSYTKLLSVLAGKRVKLTGLSGCFAHIARYEHRDDLLSAAGSRLAPGRYHIEGGAPALYFAESPVTALVEVEQLLGSEGALVLNRRPPMLLVNVDVTVPAGTVLDLTSGESVCDALGTSFQELTGSWLLEEDPPTQRLGQAAYDSNKIVAIRYPSGKWRGATLQRNVVVFRDRLNRYVQRGATLRPFDPDSVLPPTIRSIPYPKLPFRR